MITIQNEGDFQREFSSGFSDDNYVTLNKVVEWIDKNLKPEDVFTIEKLQKYEKQKS